MTMRRELATAALATALALTVLGLFSVPARADACNPADDDGCLCVHVGCGPNGGAECAKVEIPGRDAVYCAGWETVQ